jgi:hypothetical protein
VIARVRRAMPRNPDVMAICDAFEETLHKPAVETLQPNETFHCPVCEARRAADQARLRRHRAKKTEAEAVS